MVGRRLSVEAPLKRRDIRSSSCGQGGGRGHKLCALHGGSTSHDTGRHYYLCDFCAPRPLYERRAPSTGRSWAAVPAGATGTNAGAAPCGPGEEKPEAARSNGALRQVTDKCLVKTTGKRTRKAGRGRERDCGRGRQYCSHSIPQDHESLWCERLRPESPRFNNGRFPTLPSGSNPMALTNSASHAQCSAHCHKNIIRMKVSSYRRNQCYQAMAHCANKDTHAFTLRRMRVPTQPPVLRRLDVAEQKQDHAIDRRFNSALGGRAPRPTPIPQGKNREMCPLFAPSPRGQANRSQADKLGLERRPRTANATLVPVTMLSRIKVGPRSAVGSPPKRIHAHRLRHDILR